MARAAPTNPERMIMTTLSPTITPRERAAIQQATAPFWRRKIAEMREELAWTTSQLSMRAAEHGAIEAEQAQNQAALREAQVQIIAADEAAERLRRDNAEMRKALAEERTREINLRVDTALATYCDKKDLSESSRKMLTHLCSTLPDEFDRAYPQIDSEHQHLLRNFTARGSRDPRGGALPPDPQPMALEQIAAAIQREHPGVAYEHALDRAEKLIKGAQK
ncbi:MAG: hypothetical protein ABJB12_03840 [Pseudomonadota bacterium]